MRFSIFFAFCSRKAKTASAECLCALWPALWPPSLLSIILAATQLAAKSPIEVLYVCDSGGDRIMSFTDFNKSGAVEMESLGEIAVFYDDSSPGPDLSTPSHMAAGADGSFYVLDGGTLDAVLCLSDKNGDGDANDDGEITLFYDRSTGGPRLSTPNTLIAFPDGSFYLSDDGSSGRRVVWIKDTNGDGDALDPDEARVVYDVSALSLPLLEDIESLARGSDNVLFAGDSTLQTIFVFHDANGDGDFLDADEVSIFFQGAGDLVLADIESMAFVSGALYAADKSTGRILKLEDKNHDGDAADEGEASVFLDQTASLRVSGITDFIAIEGGGFIILDNSKDTVFRVTDLNGDGDALDEGEVIRWLIDDGSTLATPSGLVLMQRMLDPPVGAHFLRGDSTGDGKIDISDPIATLGYLFLGRVIETCLDALDADDTGQLNISDAIFSLNFLFSGGSRPLPPFPEPGPDPTADSIDC